MGEKHFVDGETVLSSTSIRHLPLKQMGFLNSGSRLFLPPKDFLSIVQKLSDLTKAQAERRAINALRRVGKDAAKHEAIYELLMEHDYRKSPRRFTPSEEFKSRIEYQVKRQAPVELIIPLFPCKVHNRLKSLGFYPDFAEILSLTRLLEICRAIRHIYEGGGRVTVLADGSRFQKAWNIPQTDIVIYQQKLRELIGLLEAGEQIRLIDYEELLDKRLSFAKKYQRARALKRAVEKYRQMTRCVEAQVGNSYKIRLRLAQESDPDFDNSDPEGRFVPLFRSTIFSVYFPKVYNSRNADKETLMLFQDIYDVRDQTYGPRRLEILMRTWGATMEYVAVVRADHEVEPFEEIFPHALRCTIHSKPGQLALTTVNKRTRIESWHGTGYIRSNGRTGVDFRISLESEGYLPVCIMGDPFGMGKQPMFYTTKEIFEEATKQRLVLRV